MKTTDTVEILRRLAADRIELGNRHHEQIGGPVGPLTNAQGDAFLNHPLMPAVEWVARKTGFPPQDIQEFAERVGTPLGLALQKERILGIGKNPDGIPEIRPERRDLHHLLPAIVATDPSELVQLLESEDPGLIKRLDIVTEVTSKSDRRAEWVGKVLMLRKHNPEMSKKQIAQKAGIHPGTLSPERCPEFADLEKMMASATTSGYVISDSETGLTDVEAVAPDGKKSDRGIPVPNSSLYREYCDGCGESMRVAKSKVGTSPLCDDCA